MTAQPSWIGYGYQTDGNGNIIDLQKGAGLDWQVETKPVLFNAGDWENPSMATIPGRFAIVRGDTQMPLGIVGNAYKPLQNQQMFQFIETFNQEAGGAKIETIGALRDGQKVWALAHNKTVEYIHGDPVKKYILFVNSFDGSGAVSICFTDIRLVCWNALQAALTKASHIWSVRHTNQMKPRIDEIHKTLAGQEKYEKKLNEVMGKLATTHLTATIMKNLATQLVLGEASELEELGEAADDYKITTRQQHTIEKIMELVETGKGTDIPGVRGTAYGLLQACTEYADHHRTIRSIGGRSLSEARFESVMMGSAAIFKQKAFDTVLQIAA